MAGEIYNTGDEDMNCSKKEICSVIAKKVNYYYYSANIGKDLDARNYLVSYSKIKEIGYQTTIDIDTGIDELVSGIQALKVFNPYSNVSYH